MNRTIIVCGGSKGIGAATVVLLLKQGYSVVALSRSSGELDKDILDNKDFQLKLVDFSDPRSRQSAFNVVTSIPNLYGVVNNSAGPSTGTIQESSVEDYLSAFQTHLFAANELTKIVVPIMKKNGQGRIVNIISITAKIPLENLAVSNTLRGAMLNWSKTLSKELGKSCITVNSVLPGYTETTRLKEVISGAALKNAISDSEQASKIISQIPMGRFAFPNEIAEVICFLFSNGASYLNGAAIPVDGGWSSCT